LKKSFGIVSVGFPGAVSPDRGAAVIVLPKISRRPNRLNYVVDVVDSQGSRQIATIPVPTDCTLMGRPHAKLQAFWSPANRAAILVGNIMVENPCDTPTMTPVLIVANVHGPAEPAALTTLATRLESKVNALSKNHIQEALAVNVQIMSIKPNSPTALIRVAKLQARTQHVHRAISALWHLRSLADENALMRLRRIQHAEWTRPFRKHLSYQELLRSLPDKLRTPLPSAPQP
jgi:hypothetical protein